MTLPTEPIGSIPRSRELMEGMSAAAAGRLGADRLEALFDDAVRDTIRRFEETGSPVITDGEQRKPSFATYPIHGAKNLAPGGVAIKFKDGHERQLPVLNAGPFRYTTYAASYLDAAKKHAHKPLKEAVISASALSLLYPQAGIPGYSREAFLDDLVERGREGHSPVPGPGRARPDRLHRGTPRGEARSVQGAAEFLHRSEQPRARRASRPANGRRSASIRARAATRTRRTAPTWTTRSCCPRSFG